MSWQISQKQPNFPKLDENKSFLDFWLVYIHLIMEALNLIRDKFVDNNFYIKELWKFSCKV